MKQRPSNLAAAVSLLLCAAVCGLWLWSYAATPLVAHQRPGRTSVVAAYRGRLLFETGGRNDTPLWPGLRALGGGFRAVAPESERLYLDATHLRPGAVLGFQRYTRAAGAARHSAVTIPCWFVIGLLLLLPAHWLARALRRRRRIALGRCAACGYDLRATPERCPECGAARPPHNPPPERTVPAV